MTAITSDLTTKLITEMGRDRPVLYLFAAEPLADGRVRGIPLRVSLETAEWLVRERRWAVVGPDPDDECELAAWERAARPND